MIERVTAFALAAALLWFAWQAGALLFVAWYSGVEPPLSAGQRLWLWLRLCVLVAAAVLLVVPWPAGAAGR